MAMRESSRPRMSCNGRLRMSSTSGQTGSARGVPQKLRLARSCCLAIMGGDEEIAFPVWKSEIPHRKSLFLWRKSEIPHRKSLFPCRKSEMPHRKLLFLRGKGKMPRRKSRFPCGKGEIPHWKLLFPCGKSKIPRRKSLFLCVGSGEYHHHCRFSCLGRKFRLDEPQRKKDFRKRSLQDVVPAPPSVKDQAFDQQCIEEHHEWRRNDPPA